MTAGLMFLAHRMSDNMDVLIRKDAVRFVEPVDEDSILLYVDGVGQIVTNTYDLEGFAMLVFADDSRPPPTDPCQRVRVLDVNMAMGVFGS